MREEAIRRIVAILKDEEYNLSDSYDYYCGIKEVETVLHRIAERVIDDLPLSYRFQENRIAGEIVEVQRRKGYEKKNDR